jgi:hypothetical protein
MLNLIALQGESGGRKLKRGQCRPTVVKRLGMGLEIAVRGCVVDLDRFEGLQHFKCPVF